MVRQDRACGLDFWGSYPKGGGFAGLEMMGSSGHFGSTGSCAESVK